MAFFHWPPRLLPGSSVWRCAVPRLSTVAAQTRSRRDCVPAGVDPPHLLTTGFSPSHGMAPHSAPATGLTPGRARPCSSEHVYGSSSVQELNARLRAGGLPCQVSPVRSATKMEPHAAGYCSLRRVHFCPRDVVPPLFPQARRKRREDGSGRLLAGSGESRPTRPELVFAFDVRWALSSRGKSLPNFSRGTAALFSERFRLDTKVCLSGATHSSTGQIPKK